MNFTYTTYITATGRITGQHDNGDPQLVIDNLPGDQSILWGEKVDDHLFYLPDGIKTPRPHLGVPEEFSIAADGIEAVEFALPAGSKVFAIEPWTEWLDEDEFHVTTNEIGTIVYKIEPAFPYQSPHWVKINAA